MASAIKGAGDTKSGTLLRLRFATLLATANELIE
jgi:hypothetical protein